MDAALIKSQLDSHELALREGAWPLQDSSGADLFLDVGADPSLSSSGVCVILRNSSTILCVKTHRQVTSPEHPTPLRYAYIVTHLKSLMLEALQGHDFKHLHITFLFEEPPALLSSSGWLFALNQFLWVSFGSDSALGQLCSKGRVTFNQLAINVSQFKSFYLNRVDHYGLTYTYQEIKKSKKILKEIIKKVVEDLPELFKFLPKKYNHDVAESIILAACAGVCSTFNGFSEPQEMPQYPSIPADFLYALMVNKAVNKKRERLGWIYRPLEHSFSWQMPSSASVSKNLP